MTPHSIPAHTPAALRKGDAGTAVWALQRALGPLAERTITEDGAFGQETEAVVKRYQSTRSLLPDGVAGPATQARLVRSLVKVADPDTDLPIGLLRSIVEGESGNFIAAVNWGSPGGADCGYVQRRVYEPYHEDDVRRAFDSLYQIKLLYRQLLNLSGIFRTRPAVHDSERAMRLAVLSHNYPAGADRLSRTPEAQLTSYWTTPQKWVVDIGAHFNDGHVVQTPLAWAKFYSLGDSNHQHKGKMLKYVTSWS